ncbi:uncharacterized protein TNCV_1158051 [Trichonephila clavipes]|nr:uncharacterized protein TNCV_1158051 [Trichonephila clavipes]
MEVSPTRQAQDTVTGISALHMSLHDGRSPQPKEFLQRILPDEHTSHDQEKGGNAANCFMKPRCLKCGKEHATKNCHIKERLINPFCINCQDFGHSACYTKCPKFPQPKKGTAFTNPIKKKNFVGKWTKEGISFANVVSGEICSQTPPENNNNKKEDSPVSSLAKKTIFQI